MDVLLGKIYALQKTNAEIIARVEAVQEVVTHSYWMQYNNDGSFNLNEIVEKKKVSTITSEQKFRPKFKTDIWDVFNDKPDWNVQSWADLKNLNDFIGSVVEKFELLDKSNKKVSAELEKYLYNLEEIQQSLGAVEALTLSQKSRKQELEGQLKKINTSIQAFMDNGVSTQPLVFAGSTLLNPDHVVQLREWYGDGWKLAYKASRDGWAASDFHALCDNKGKSITVVSHSKGAFLIGGYTSLSWTSVGGAYMQDTQASLFTLVNPHSVVSKFVCSSSRNSIYCKRSCGPTFGGGPDLCVSSNANAAHSSYCGFPHSFSDTSGYGRQVMDNGSPWSADDVEVFIISS